MAEQRNESSAAREHRESVNVLYESAVESGITSAAQPRPDPRGWHIATAKIRDGIDELFDQGEDEERVRRLVLSQLRQVLDDREQR